YEVDDEPHRAGFDDPLRTDEVDLAEQMPDRIVRRSLREGEMPERSSSGQREEPIGTHREALGDCSRLVGSPQLRRGETFERQRPIAEERKSRLNCRHVPLARAIETCPQVAARQL